MTTDKTKTSLWRKLMASMEKFALWYFTKTITGQFSNRHRKAKIILLLVLTIFIILVYYFDPKLLPFHHH